MVTPSAPPLLTQSVVCARNAISAPSTWDRSRRARCWNFRRNGDGIYAITIAVKSCQFGVGGRRFAVRLFRSAIPGKMRDDLQPPLCVDVSGARARADHKRLI